MPEDFKPFAWDPSKIVSGRLTADRIVTESVDYSDIVQDPTFPWLLTTRQDLESRRQTTTASSTGSASPSLALSSPNDRHEHQWSLRSRRQSAGVARRLWDLLKRAVGSSGY